MKTLVIIIPGAKIEPSVRVKKLFGFFYRFFGIDTAGRHWAYQLKQYLENDQSISAEVFDWPRGFSQTFTLKPATRKLAKLIAEEQKDFSKIILFGKSLGGTIAKLAVLNNPNLPIEKIIYVAVPHKISAKQIPQHIKIINIYSDIDNYISFANMVLYCGFGKKIINNAVNINLPLKHGDFNRNIEVSYNNQNLKLFELYKKLVLEG